LFALGDVSLTNSILLQALRIIKHSLNLFAEFYEFMVIAAYLLVCSVFQTRLLLILGVLAVDSSVLEEVYVEIAATFYLEGSHFSADHHIFQNSTNWIKIHHVIRILRIAALIALLARFILGLFSVFFVFNYNFAGAIFCSLFGCLLRLLGFGLFLLFDLALFFLLSLDGLLLAVFMIGLDVCDFLQEFWRFLI